jgi:hypothetical protein
MRNHFHKVKVTSHGNWVVIEVISESFHSLLDSIRLGNHLHNVIIDINEKGVKFCLVFLQSS